MVVALSRVRVTWTGIPSGNGVTTLYVTGGQTPNLGAIRSAFSNMSTLIPAAVTINIANQGDIIQDTTGALVGQWSAAAQAALPMTGAGSYVPAQGGLVRLQTDTIAKNRHLRGRIFLAPLVTAAFGSNGQLSAGAVTGLQSFAAALMTATAAPFAVWSRPKTSKDEAGNVAVLEEGSSGVVTAATATGFAAVLRSRRD